MRFDERVQRCAERLTPADRRLVTLLLADPAAGALASSPQLARHAGVTPASLTRLSRKLGFAGFAALRESLQAEMLGGRDSAGRLAGSLAGVGSAGALASVVRQETAALAALTRHVDEARVDAAAALLVRARQVALAAEGTAVAVALALERKLCRLGRPARLARADARGLAEALGPLQPGDALVVVALDRPPERYPALIVAARAGGLASLVLADDVGPLLEPAPDLLLAAPRGPRGTRRSLVVPCALVAAVTLAVARADPGAAAALRRYDALVSALAPAGAGH